MKSKGSKTVKRGILFGCIGVLLLSVSVFAAYGSASGYGKYKDAVIDLVTATDNATIRMEQVVRLDGEERINDTSIFRVDGKNQSIHSKSVNDSWNEERFYSEIDGSAEEFYVENDFYSVYSVDDEYGGEGFFGGYGEGEKKLVKFGSLLADTVLGDLKNNVVLVGEKDGIKDYRLDVKAEQMPPLINAALDLANYNENSYAYTTYEDEEATVKAYYEKTYGEPLPEAAAAYINGDYDDFNFEEGSAEEKAYDEAWESYYEIFDEMESSYQKIIDENNCFLYVNKDGSYESYDSYSEMAVAENMATDVSDFFFRETILDNVISNFRLDENDDLVANDCSVTFTATDAEGKAHKIEYFLKLTVSDRGSTVVERFDTGGRTMENLDEE